jgi:hypothetical protein
MPGEVSDIVGDHELRSPGDARLRRQILFRVAKQPDHGADEREVVQQVAANGRVLR